VRRRVDAVVVQHDDLRVQETADVVIAVNFARTNHLRPVVQARRSQPSGRHLQCSRLAPDGATLSPQKPATAIMVAPRIGPLVGQ
jgi:hypothetical protein